MSKRADRERAEAGTIYRDKLVSSDAYNEKAANYKLFVTFMRKSRLKSQPGDDDGNCPVCRTPKPLTARRITNVVEHLCKKCYFNWEDPLK